MCGIFVLWREHKSIKCCKDLYLQCASKMDHRGTISNVVYTSKCYMYHRRLAINDLSHLGDQPFSSNGVYSVINGEIYNYPELRKLLSPDVTFKSTSDCEVIIPLYLKYGTHFITKLRGMFSGVIYDSRSNKLIAFRDTFGITSLYYGYTSNNELLISSELKTMDTLCTNVHVFPPGKILQNSTFITYRKSDWSNPVNIDTINYEQPDLVKLRGLFIDAVLAQSSLTDVPHGYLLSGGLDSSLLVGVAAHYSKVPLKTFTIGLKNSVDVVAAECVAKYLGNLVDHTSFTFTVDEALCCLEEVIYMIETYDITTVRASLPMYILMNRIKTLTNVKVILSGEGSDEQFFGYSYFHYAPSAREIQLEGIDKMNNLHLYDNLRSHKCAMGNTIEIRPPFLHDPFVNYVMTLNPYDKMPATHGIEKYILRKAFSSDRLIPDEILWRKKEQFSDGISSESENLIDSLKHYAESQISDSEFNSRFKTYPYNPPISKEQYLYRKLFAKRFNDAVAAPTVAQNDKSIACSTARGLKWMNISHLSKDNDPSGRILEPFPNEKCE